MSPDAWYEEGYLDGYDMRPWDGPGEFSPRKNPDRRAYSDGYVAGQIDRNMGRSTKETR